MDAIAQFFVEWGYVGLFLSAFIAGSILPFSSEAVMVILTGMGLDPVGCLIAASLGNTLGGMTARSAAPSGSPASASHPANWPGPGNSSPGAAP